MAEPDKLKRFEETMLQHLPAAYNFARWLARKSVDTEDLVQESYLRAFKAFDAFRGGNGRAWLLTIVRNTWYTWQKQDRRAGPAEAFDEELHAVASQNPEALLCASADARLLQQALEELPLEFREVIILRELEGMSYKEIANLADIPIGTVMSRLARARERLQHRLTGSVEKEP